jgi:hypothetical protein
MAFALLLATAPVAGATEITREIKPEVRAVEVAAPSIRQSPVAVAAQAEVRSTKAARATQMDRHTWTIVIIALAVAAAALLLL